MGCQWFRHIPRHSDHKKAVLLERCLRCISCRGSVHPSSACHSGGTRAGKGSRVDVLVLGGAQFSRAKVIGKAKSGDEEGDEGQDSVHQAIIVEQLLRLTNWIR